MVVRAYSRTSRSFDELTSVTCLAVKSNILMHFRPPKHLRDLFNTFFTTRMSSLVMIFLEHIRDHGIRYNLSSNSTNFDADNAIFKKLSAMWLNVCGLEL